MGKMQVSDQDTEKAMILSNATRALKKALKEEWQKRQNEKEHEKLVEESIDIQNVEIQGDKIVP